MIQSGYLTGLLEGLKELIFTWVIILCIVIVGQKEEIC